MYEYLTGRLVERRPDEVVLDLGGVGYRLAVSGASVGRLPPDGSLVTLFVVHRVRDEEALLFGFHSREERAFFLKLLGVSRIGPTTALSLLSALEPATLAAAVEAGDAATLARVRGVGKRTAERLCVELKGRLGTPLPLPGRLTDRTSAVASALLALGYPRGTAREAAAAAVAGANPEATLEELVKQGLRRTSAAGAGGAPTG